MCFTDLSTLSSLALWIPMPEWIKKWEIIIYTGSTRSISKLHSSEPTTTNMLANKTFLFAVAAAFMALATVEAVPVTELVPGKLHLLLCLCQPFIPRLFRLTKVPRFYLVIARAECVDCSNPPPCTLRCPRGYCVSASLLSFWSPKRTFFFLQSIAVHFNVLLIFVFKVPTPILFLLFFFVWTKPRKP